MLATALTTLLSSVALTLTLAAVTATGLVLSTLWRAPGRAALLATIAFASAAITSLTATVASAVSTAAAATIAASSWGAAATVGGLIDTDPASVEFLVVQRLHGGIGLSIVRISDEAETPAAARVAVLDDDGFFDLAKLLELLAQRSIVGVPSKASNKKF